MSSRTEIAENLMARGCSIKVAAKIAGGVRVLAATTGR